MIKIIESPREAMQGIVPFIPTEIKVQYINAMLKVGFDTVEVGSFVSPKAIPQMIDTREVLKQIGTTGTRSKRMVLVVNKKGAVIASQIDCIDCISYPFSISPSFSRFNLNSSLEKQIESVHEISALCGKTKKEFIVYISMAFGNPYGDEWNLDILSEWIAELQNSGIRTIPLSNVSVEIEKTLINKVFSVLIPRFPGIEFGLHLHTTNIGWYDKVDAAFSNGCQRFDTVMQGMGGCPMTGTEMLGNLATENLYDYLSNKNEIPEGLNRDALNFARNLSQGLPKG